MNIFFYSAGNTACKNGCSYQRCSQHCLHVLQGLAILQDMTVLSRDSFFSTFRDMKTRNGDLMILYAGTNHDLEELAANKDVFEEFKIILIVGDMDCVEGGKCHLLNPRYITSLGGDAAELNAVIEKMTGTV